MRVIFIDATDNNEIGSVSYQDFSEIKIPSFNQEKHDIYLKKSFTSKAGIRDWLITDLTINANTISIKLKESTHIQSFGIFRESQNRSNKNNHNIIKKYDIVEVEFGFYEDLFQLNGISSKMNNYHTNSVLLGEMHKKRPCIVIDLTPESIQVIPLTTKVPSDPNKIQIDNQAFANSSPRYSESPSYALIKHIQTVSYYRVFPLRKRDNSYHHAYHQISNNDRQLINEALTKQYNEQLLSKLTFLQNSHDKLSQEKFKILQTNAKIKSEKETLESKNRILESSLLSFGESMGAGNNIEEILLYISNNS